MNGEYNQDGSARVRHVPIQIESRAGNRSRQGQAGETASPRSHHNPSQASHYDQNHESQNNTSSININFKPAPPTRQPHQSQNQSQQAASHQYQPRQYQQEHGSSGHQNSSKYTPSRYEQQQKHLTDPRAEETEIMRGRLNSASKAASPDNSDKLLSSPEPIPLPAPAQSLDSGREHVKDTPSTGNDQASAPKPAEQVRKQQVNNQKESTENSSTLSAINAIKMDANKLLQEIASFAGTSATSKDYRYLDEMLTRCILGLDKIDCGESNELRQQRKAAIKLVDQLTDILQRKQQINADLRDLSESMATS